MLTTKIIERQMVSVGDPNSQKTLHLTSPGKEFQVKSSYVYHAGITYRYHMNILIADVHSNSDIAGSHIRV